jgi:hypothetical protein
MLSALTNMKATTSGRTCRVSWITVIALTVNQSIPASDNQKTTSDSPVSNYDASDEEEEEEKREEMQSLR